MSNINTRILAIHDPEKDSDNVKTAAEILRRGGTVVIPTETVYGLAADACNTLAVGKIFAAKGRPQDNPLIVHIANMDMLAPIVSRIPPAALLLAKHFWPGPLTMIMYKSSIIPMETSGGLSTVAVRLPSNTVARAIIEAAGVPLAAPSANLSGSPSPTSFQHCVDDMMDRVDAIVESDCCEVGVESTVISLAEPVPVLLRPGAVTLEQLRAVLGTVRVDKGVNGKLEPNTIAQSPGMKYKHYAPKAQVILIKGSSEDFVAYLSEKAAENDCAVCFTEDLPYISMPSICYGDKDNHEEQAGNIFAVLRQLDEIGIKRAYVHSPDTDGIGLAVYNRLIRAAAFNIVEL